MPLKKKSDLREEESKEEEENCRFGSRNYLKGLPEEIVMEIFKMLDVRTFMISAPYVCKEW